MKQIQVGVVNVGGVQSLIGLRGDGVLFHGQVVHGAGGKDKVQITWTAIGEELK